MRAASNLVLRGRFRGEPLQLIDALFRAHTSNPVSPHEINTPQVAKANALRSLASDLGRHRRGRML